MLPTSDRDLSFEERVERIAANNARHAGTWRDEWGQTDSAENHAHLISRCAADIVPKPIDFIWPGRIARGKHTAIAGEPGDGKSQLSVFVAATISRGGEWPCGEGRAPVGNVIILNAEDGADDTVVPRLIATGAELNRVHIVSAVLEQGGRGRRTFNLQADLALLEQKIAEIGDVALVIIDPISSYMGKVDGHKNTDVRGALEPLSEMAARLNVAILSITHFSKSGSGNSSKALHRFIGSIAFVGAPRAAFAVIEDSENEGRMLFLHAKNNMASKPQGLAYRLVQTLVDGAAGQSILASYIAWDGAPVVMSADEALRAAEEGANRSAKADAMEFLQGALAGAPVPAAEINRMAREHCLTPKVIRSAREALGVKIERDGFGPGSKSLWSLPARSSIDAQTNHRCPTPELGNYEGRGQVWNAVEQPGTPPNRPTPMSTSDPWPDYPELPDSLRRAPSAAPPTTNGRPPALGPPGDSLDDFQ
jgi:hypothetical protein